MNLSFSLADDPLKAVITDLTKGEPLYQTESHHLVNRATAINKFAPETGCQPLAKIYWETLTFVPVNMIYREERVLVVDFFEKKQGTFLTVCLQ